MLWEVIKNALGQFLKKLFDVIIEIFGPIIDALLDLVPDFGFDISFVSSSMLGILDLFFPINYCIDCVVVYLSVACVVYIINWILGLFPTIS